MSLRHCPALGPPEPCGGTNLILSLTACKVACMPAATILSIGLDPPTEQDRVHDVHDTGHHVKEAAADLRQEVAREHLALGVLLAAACLRHSCSLTDCCRSPLGILHVVGASG